MMMGLWFILLVPFVILMVVVGNWRRNEEEDEEVGSGTYNEGGTKDLTMYITTF